MSIPATSDSAGLLQFAPRLSQIADFDYKANLIFGDPYLLQQAIKTQTKYIFGIATTRRRARCISGLHWLKSVNILLPLAHRAVPIGYQIDGFISK
jgi:hypothetical protein